MQSVNCYNCGSNASSYYATENGYNLVKCDICDLLYVNPRPENSEITKASVAGKHKGDDTLDVTGSFSKEKLTTYLCILDDFFSNKLSDKNITTWLDIGCGHGEFISALKRYSNGSIIAKGFEPNIHKQKSAQQKDLDVSDFDLDNHTKKYDVISSLNVYSHLPCPPQVIENWKKLLNKGGEIFIETGDTANMSSKDHHRPFYLPDHLSFASEKIVVDILKKSGFEVQAIKKYPHIKFNVLTIVREVVKIFIPKKRSRIMSLVNYNKMKINTDMYIWAKLKQ